MGMNPFAGEGGDALLAYVLVLLLSAARTVGIVAFAPGFSASGIPPTIRMTMAIAIGLATGSHLSGGRAVDVTDLGLYMITICAELAFGLVIGYGVSLLFEAVRFAGDVLDIQVGISQATSLDPSSDVQTSVISRSYHFFAIIVFLQLNGHHWLLAGLARSFEIVPIGAPVFNADIVQLFVELVGSIFAVGLHIASPVVGAVFLTDLCFGFIARVVPQMNVFLVGIPAKLLVGLAVLSFSAPLMFYTVAELLDGMKEYITMFVQFMSG